MSDEDHDDHCIIKKLSDKAVLYVISVISNPLTFDRRYELFIDFKERMKHEKGIKLITIELQNGNRPFVTDSTIKLRTKSIIWHKENLINIAVQHLPDDWEYMAWIDSDLEFQNKNWVKETIASWRHSIWVGVFDPWPVIKRPYLWYKCFRDGITLEPDDNTKTPLIDFSEFDNLYLNSKKLI
jgi:hypothetical protein